MGVPMIGCGCDVCRSTNPRNQRMRTGVVISHGERSFLIDTSQELRLQLTRFDVRMIEAVVYTHAHADHIMGLDDLRIFGYLRKAPIPLYCEAPVEETIRNTFSYAFADRTNALHSAPSLEFVRIDETPFDVCGLTLTPIRLIHGRLPLFGFRINNVAFCTDVSAIPEESWPKLQGLDTLILGALREEPHPTHFTVGQAVEVIERLQPRRAFLTHLGHQLEYDEMNRKLPEGIELAYDGLMIDLI